MNNKVAAFGQRRAGVYLLSEIYDPTDTTSSVQNINKVIPAIGSLVVDDTVGEHNTLYIVYSVDAVTHKSTLVRASTLMSENEEDNRRMLFFKKSMYYYQTADTVRQDGKYYYIKQTVQNVGITYTLHSGAFENGVTYYEAKELYELHVDANISSYTSQASSYIIYHTSALNSVTTGTEIVSRYYFNDTDEMITNVSIPMEEFSVPVTNDQGLTEVTQMKRPRICYSDIPIIPGDKYLVVVQDMLPSESNPNEIKPHVIGQFVLTAQSMSALSVIGSTRRVITGISVNCAQYIDRNQFFINQNQTIDDLAFFLKVTYANSDPETVAIDGVRAFMYTEGDIKGLSVNSTIKIVFKYFPSHMEDLQLAGSADYTIGSTGRFVSIVCTLTVRESIFSTVSKIAPILYYYNNRWNIVPLVYLTSGDTNDNPIISNDRNTPDGVKKAVDDFNGGYIDGPQTVKLSYHVGEDTIQTITNTVTVKLNSLSNPDKVFYYFYDKTGVYYGQAPHPSMKRVGSGNTYKFTAVENSGNYTPKEAFLQNYYYNANPPAPYSSGNPLVPTYFRIRKLIMSVSGTSYNISLIPLATGLIDINSFFAQTEDQRIVTSDLQLHESNSAIPTTVVVEFLYQEATGLRVLYGVPVDVYPS